MRSIASSTRRFGCRIDVRRSAVGTAAGSVRAPVMRPEIIGCRSALHRSVLERCGHLNSNYAKPSLLLNGHVETIWASWFRPFLNLELDRELVDTPDGGVIALDTLKTEEVMSPDTPIVLLLPGLAGGSSCSYVQFAIRSAHASGFRAVVFNSRGMGSSPLRTPQFYSASYTEDLRHVVRHLHDKYPKAQLCAVGWSLGANILVNYLGEEGDGSSLLAAVSLCNPFDLARCDANWKTGFSQVYSWNLASSMKNNFRDHMHLFDGYDVDRAMTASTVREVDEAITCVTFGWESVDAYYHGSSSAHRLGHVRTPMLCIQAADDPICPAECIPTDTIENNENCLLVVTPHGGHLGWVTTEDGWFGPPWTDKAAFEWLSAILEHVSSTEAIPQTNGTSLGVELCGAKNR